MAVNGPVELTDGAPEQTPAAVMQAAWHYYHDDLTQNQIAERLGVSRATVGRLLHRARQEGLVSITLHPKLHGAFGVGTELAERYGLASAVIVPMPSGQEGLTDRLAFAGSQHLMSILGKGQTLAVGWGNTVSRTLLSLPKGVLNGVRLVTLTGGADAYLRALVSAGGGPDAQDAHVVPAPLLASSPELAEALIGEKSVIEALAAAQSAEHTLVGIGSTHPDATVVQLGYQSAADLKKLAKRGVVGDMLGRFYDGDGAVVELSLYTRVIGTDLSQLRKMRDVIAIAGGEQKLPAIRGALRGGYVNTLITDEATARALLI